MGIKMIFLYIISLLKIIKILNRKPLYNIWARNSQNVKNLTIIHYKGIIQHSTDCLTSIRSRVVSRDSCGGAL
jgi:hypothetical protein